MKTSVSKMAVLAVTAAAVIAAPFNAQACSRYVAETDHGISVIRSLDWGQKLGAVAKVHPVGEVRTSGGVEEYSKIAAWKVKYHTVAMEEHELFHGTASEAVNDQGLSAMVLYMNDSKEYTQQHEDTGAPAVSITDAVSYFAENYATVADVLEAHENGEFQIAWASTIRGSDKYHGVHFSVVDKSGAIALFQINEGGVEVVHTGDKDSDLRVMANAPLQQDHRAYVAQFDLENDKVGTDLPSTIGSKDRNLRLLWASQHQDYSGLDKVQTAARMQQTFDASAMVMHGIEDPQDNGSAETYATWVTFLYNLETGEFSARNMETAQSISFTLEDTKAYGEPVCADLMEQASKGLNNVVWSSCAVPTH